MRVLHNVTLLIFLRMSIFINTVTYVEGTGMYFVCKGISMYKGCIGHPDKCKAVIYMCNNVLFTTCAGVFHNPCLHIFTMAHV